MKQPSPLEPAALQSLRLAELVEKASKCFTEAIEAYEEHRLATDQEFRSAGGDSGTYSAPARIENTLFSILKAAGLARFDRHIAAAPDHGLVDENGLALRHFTLGHPACQAAKERAEAFIAEDKVAITTQIEDAQNAFLVMARKGGRDTPEAVEAFATVRRLYNDLGKNPAFGYPAERVESEIARVDSLAMTEAIVGEVDRTYDRNGRAAAQRYLTDNILNNEKLRISPDQRSKAYSQGLARLQFRDGETKAQVDAHRQTVSTIVTGLQSRVQIPDAQVDEAIGRAQALGDAESVKKLEAARTVAALRRGTGLTDEQELRQFAGVGSGPQSGAQQQVYQRFLAGGLSPVMAFGLLGNIGMESSFNTSARNAGDGRDGSDSIGLAQWNGPRAAALKQFAQARGRDWRDVETQADFVVHELRTTERRAFNALSTATTAEEAGRAAIGYFRPAGFSWANPDGAHNSGKRIDSARVLAQTLGGGAAPAASPFTPEQLRANPFLGSAWIQAQVADQKEVIATASRIADAISTGIDKGMLPDPQTFAALLQIADQFPDQLGRTRNDLIAKAQGYDDSQIALGQPTTVGDQLVRDAMAAAQGAPILVQQTAQAMKDAYDRGVKNLKDQPWNEAVRRGWAKMEPAPLDLTNQGSLNAGFALRAEIAGAIAARSGAGQSALSPGDVAQISNVWNYGTADQKSSILAAISQLPDQMIEPTLRSLGEDKQSGELAFVAGLHREAPGAAMAVIRGQQAMLANPRFAPKPEEWKSDAMEKSLPLSIAAPERVGIRQYIGAAVKSVYAGLSARDGDESGSLNQARLDEATGIVTGGLVEHNGSKLIPPTRGMTQDQFEKLLWSLPDADFAAAATKSGQRVTAQDVRRNFVLRGVADGRYALQARNSPGEWLYQPPVLGRDIDNTAGGYQGEQRFVLDLKGRKPSEGATARGGQFWRFVR